DRLPAHPADRAGRLVALRRAARCLRLRRRRIDRLGNPLEPAGRIETEAGRAARSRVNCRRAPIATTSHYSDAFASSHPAGRAGTGGIAGGAGMTLGWCGSAIIGLATLAGTSVGLAQSPAPYPPAQPPAAANSVCTRLEAQLGAIDRGTPDQ